MHAHWSPLFSVESATPAPALYGHSLLSVDDVDSPYVVCFGGTAGEGVNSQTNAVWTWRQSEGWREAQVKGLRPEPRGWHGAAVLDQKLYIYGGNRWHQSADAAKPTRQIFGDFWELDLQSWQWQDITPSNPAAAKPSPRSACAMAAEDNFVLLYGGKNFAVEIGAYMGDLWVFSTTDATWTLVCDTHQKGPVARALPTFVATPLGFFLYGGTGASRLPLCDLWHLERPVESSAESSGALNTQFQGRWVPCKCLPMCPVEHTVGAEEPPLTRSTHAGERVAVGHDGHASALTNDTLLVVWSGLMGRMPKRGLLASMPPAPHLTGNLFVLDLAAVDHGWAMLPPSSIHSGDGLTERVPPRKWASMASIGPGRLLVHGGFGGKTVSRDAHVLEVQASKHTRHAHSRHASVAEEPQLNVHKSPDRRGGEESVAQHSQEEVAATKASRSPVARSEQQVEGRAVQKKGQGPAFHSVFSSMLGGVYKGVESLSNEAVSAIQKVASPTNSNAPKATPAPPLPESGRPDPRRTATTNEGQISYSSRPPEAPHAFAEDLGHQSHSDAQVAAWMLSNASAPTAAGVQVLVPTSDCLMMERPSNTLAKRSKFRAKSEGHPGASSASPPSPTRTTLSLSNPPGGLKRPITSLEGGLVAATPDARTTGASGQAEDNDEDSESPVSLWISPAGALASGKPLEGHPEDSWTDAASAADIAELLDDLLAAVEASESVHGDDALRQPLLENSGSFQFSPAPREEYHVVWPLGGSPLDTSSPREGDQDRVNAAGSVDRAPDAGNGASQQELGPASSSAPDLHTAFVEDMLATDPVVALGLRIASRGPATLEYVSIDEARTDLRQRACTWLHQMPSAPCLRCKDVQALVTEYRRLAPLTLTGEQALRASLGSLAHVSLDQMRLRDLDVILSEFKELVNIASERGFSRPVRGNA